MDTWRLDSLHSGMNPSAETNHAAIPGVSKPRPVPPPTAAGGRAGGRTRRETDGNPKRRPELPNQPLIAAALIGLFLVAPNPTAAQDDPASSKNPAELLKEARDRQEEFERYRASRIPVERVRSQPSCDELIGRICIWFGGEGETGFPAEWPEVGEARIDLISFLTETAERVPDRWVIGQLVYYLIEARDVDGATRVATDCGIREVWWCAALRGYILHLTADYVASEEAFREALALMPPDERERWMSPRFVLTEDGVELFAGMDPAERDRLFELFWHLSDPLFLIEGNDRLTDHFARMVEAVNWREGANPMGLPWDEDMEATLIRYGRNIGYSRTYDPIASFRTLGDTRKVLGHHHPKSRGYLFPEMFLESPSDVPPESWITAPREARTWFAPRYSPDMRPLETQVGRFRRGEMMLVVGAFRPVQPEADSGGKNRTGGSRGTRIGHATEGEFRDPGTTSFRSFPDSRGRVGAEIRPGQRRGGRLDDQLVARPVRERAGSGRPGGQAGMAGASGCGSTPAGAWSPRRVGPSDPEGRHTSAGEPR